MRPKGPTRKQVMIWLIAPLTGIVMLTVALCVTFSMQANHDADRCAAAGGVLVGNRHCIDRTATIPLP